MSDNHGLGNAELQNLAVRAVADYVEKVKLAESKEAFVGAADMGGGGGMPPGGDPMAGGGMPPGGMPPGGMPPGGMPPGGMPPGDPSMMGGMPPPPMPPAPMPPAMPPAADPNALKPKIDVNVEIMQMKNMLAKIIDALGIQVPAQEMVATPEKLQEMAAGGGPGSGGEVGPPSEIQPPQPIEPMGAAAPAGPEKMGALVIDRTGFSTPIDTESLGHVANKASAIMMLRSNGRNGAA